jgi:phage/conjugal plasmid C-4 type zinc finger TraR family protein
MTDFYDRAQELEQKQRDAARPSGSRQPSAGCQPDPCDDCGESIPQKRREAAPGCTRCITCQDEPNSTKGKR